MFLPWVDLRPERLIVKPYGKFLNHLSQKGFGDQDLFLFAFDWRLGIEHAAKELARFVTNDVRRGSSIVIVAHSLGCLAVHWALCNGLIPSVSVDRVIAAGPPFYGSAKSFRAIIEMPSIDDELDWWLNLARLRFPRIAERVVTCVSKSLMAMTSLCELMPPSSVFFLSDGSPQLFSAFQWSGWPVTLQVQLMNAENIQAQIATLKWPAAVPKTLVLSNRWPTEVGYIIDPSKPFSIAATVNSKGDGTVAEESARAYGANRELIVQAKHNLLLDDSDTLFYLDTVL